VRVTSPTLKRFLGLPELLGQHVDIGLTQAHHRLVAHYIDIGGDGVEQRGFLGGAKALLPGLYRGPGLADGVEILEALEDGLAEIDGIATRIGDAVAGNVAVLTKVGLACEKRGAEGRLSCAFPATTAGE